MEIKIFDNPTFGRIRTAGTPEEPLFCLVDVCAALGMKKFRVERLSKDVISNLPLSRSPKLATVNSYLNLPTITHSRRLVVTPCLRFLL